MNKSQIIENISSRISSLDNLISRTNSQYAGVSKSHLVVSTTRKVIRFYRITGKGDSATRTYVSDTTELKKLAENTYQKKLLKAAVNEKKQLEKCVKTLTTGLDNSDAEKVFDSLQEPIKTMLERVVQRTKTSG